MNAHFVKDLPSGFLQSKQMKSLRIDKIQSLFKIPSEMIEEMINSNERVNKSQLF